MNNNLSQRRKKRREKDKKHKNLAHKKHFSYSLSPFGESTRRGREAVFARNIFLMLNLGLYKLSTQKRDLNPALYFYTLYIRITKKHFVDLSFCCCE